MTTEELAAKIDDEWGTYRGWLVELLASARREWELEAIAAQPRPEAHELYKDGDKDAPKGIKDRNGHVVLSLCRKCGKGEAELSGPCQPRPEAPASEATINVDDVVMAFNDALSKLAALLTRAEHAEADTATDTMLAMRISRAEAERDEALESLEDARDDLAAANGKIVTLMAEMGELRSLVDGASDVVELFGTRSNHTSQQEWARKWNEKARALLTRAPRAESDMVTREFHEVTVSKKSKAIAAARAERDEWRDKFETECFYRREWARKAEAAEKECEEQARLNGMGAERELALMAKLNAAEAERDRLRMQLAACGVVALSNTRESAKTNRQMHADYRSASCDDVAGIVDSEISLREQNEALRAALDDCVMAYYLPGDHCEMEQAIANACALLRTNEKGGES